MYEGDGAQCSLLFPDFNQTWICQQIQLTHTLLADCSGSGEHISMNR